MTTLDVILENKERREPIAVYERMRGTNHRTGQAVDDFTGAYRYEKGRIIPFDGDSYSVYQEIIDYAWANNSQLTVWYQGDYLTAEDRAWAEETIKVKMLEIAYKYYQNPDSYNELRSQYASMNIQYEGLKLYMKEIYK